MLKSLGPIVATAIVVLFLLVSAIPLLHWFTAEGQQSTLDENRDQWRELGIGSYRMTLEYEVPESASTESVALLIRDGRAAPREDAGGDRVLPAATVEGLFDQLEDAIHATPDNLEVVYDDAYRFPRSILIDPETAIAGDETRLVITRFDPRIDASPVSTGEDMPQ